MFKHENLSNANLHDQGKLQNALKNRHKSHSRHSQQSFAEIKEREQFIAENLASYWSQKNPEPNQLTDVTNIPTTPATYKK